MALWDEHISQPVTSLASPIALAIHHRGLGQPVPAVAVEGFDKRRKNTGRSAPSAYIPPHGGSACLRRSARGGIRHGGRTTGERPGGGAQPRAGSSGYVRPGTPPYHRRCRNG